MSKNIFGTNTFSTERLSNTLSGNAFSCTTGLNIVSGVSESDYFLFRNPSGSTKMSIIHSINVGIDSSTARSIFKLYHSPTITAVGTQLTAVNNLVGGSAPTCLIYRQPTISVRGVIAHTIITSGVQDSGWLDMFIALAAAGDILITVTNSSGNISTKVDIAWSEVSV